MRALFVLLAVLVFASSTFGLAMGPARVEYIFKPGISGSFELIITENSGQETEIIMYAEGDLAQYITDISPSNFTLQPNETKKATYSFRLPESLSKYGRNETLVVAKTGTANRSRSGQIMAVVAIGHQFWVHVPYPYEYAEIGIKTENVALDVVQSGQPVFFDVSQTNLGSKDLNTTLSFELWDPDGKRIKRFEPRQNVLAREDTKIEEFDWISDSPASIRPGIYTARASLEYGGKEPTTNDKPFKIGGPIVQPQSMETAPFEAGQIAHITVKLESIWGNAIDNVFSRAFILNEDGVSIRESPPSQAVTVEAWNTRGVDLFLNTADLEAKTYDLNVVAYFGSSNASRVFSFTIPPKTAPAPETKEENGLLLLLGAGIIILLIVIAALAIVVLKKKNKPAQKSKAE